MLTELMCSNRAATQKETYEGLTLAESVKVWGGVAVEYGIDVSTTRALVDEIVTLEKQRMNR